MNTGFRAAGLRLPALCASLLLVAACGAPVPEVSRAPAPTFAVNQSLLSYAVETATAMRKAGKRVWCVPFARTA